MTEWLEFASCRGTDTEDFFPVGDTWAGTGNKRRAERAKAICRDCPVVMECLADAVERGDTVAVLGGTLPTERAELIRLSRIVSAA